MISIRSRPLIVFAAVLLGAILGEAQGQELDKSPAELAREVATTIKASLRPPVQGVPDPNDIEDVTSHENVVEIRLVAKDAAGFAQLKANAEQLRSAKTAYHCGGVRMLFLQRGVVIHETYVAPDRRDQVTFTFDKAACDRMAKPTQADAKTLADLAVTIAAAENKTSASSRTSAFLLVDAAARQGVVDLRFVFADAWAAQLDRSRFANVLAGHYCTKYHDPIFRGLAVHPVFVRSDGAPAFDFTIDRSKC